MVVSGETPHTHEWKSSKRKQTAIHSGIYVVSGFLLPHPCLGRCASDSIEAKHPNHSLCLRGRSRVAIVSMPRSYRDMKCGNKARFASTRTDRPSWSLSCATQFDYTAMPQTRNTAVHNAPTLAISRPCRSHFCARLSRDSFAALRKLAEFFWYVLLLGFEGRLMPCYHSVTLSFPPPRLETHTRRALR